jgi:hypothetical protein
VEPQEGLRAGDVGVIVEEYPARADVPEGYELEVFAANGQTVAVVSVPEHARAEVEKVLAAGRTGQTSVGAEQAAEGTPEPDGTGLVQDATHQVSCNAALWVLLGDPRSRASLCVLACT